MNSSTQIPSDLSTEQAWQNLMRAINPRDVKVQVTNGVVCLRGIVDSYSKKVAAERAAEGVEGVIAISNEIVVVPKNPEKYKDVEIADAILLNLIHTSNDSEETFNMTVQNDWLVIEGVVENHLGKKVMVEGKVCKLQEKTTVSQNKATHTSPAREMAYWEFFT